MTAALRSRRKVIRYETIPYKRPALRMALSRVEV
jgi:hypothetical protein